jgi:hypothetical protein
MDRQISRRMIFHGAVIVLLGLAAGFPFGLLLTGAMPAVAGADSVRAWRMAHLEGLLNGMLVIAAGAVVGKLDLDAGRKRLMAWALIAMAYGNVVASTIGASFGVRGLAPTGPASNLIVYVLFVAAIVGVVIGMVLMAQGSRARSVVEIPPPGEPEHRDGRIAADGARRGSRRRRRRRAGNRPPTKRSPGEPERE